MSRKKNDDSSFVFYRSFYDAIRLIPDEKLQHSACMAICEYAFHGTEPADDADVLVKMVFTQAKPQLDANNKRRESGKTGGRKTKKYLEKGSDTQAALETETETKTETDGFANKNQCEIIAEPNVNDNDNANVNVNVNENENANAKGNQNENVNVNAKAGRAAAACVISCGQAHFTPPTRTQILDYLAEMELTIDADRFIDYYTSNGWMVGKNQMRDWKAAVRSWARQEERFQQNYQPSQNTTGKRKQKGTEENGSNGKMEPQFGLCL